MVRRLKHAVVLLMAASAVEKARFVARLRRIGIEVNNASLHNIAYGVVVRRHD